MSDEKKRTQIFARIVIRLRRETGIDGVKNFFVSLGLRQASKSRKMKSETKYYRPSGTQLGGSKT
jgi:hypothetical protein